MHRRFGLEDERWSGARVDVVVGAGGFSLVQLSCDDGRKSDRRRKRDDIAGGQGS